MITSTQVQTAQAIVNIFETDHVLGDYSAVTLLAGDTGQLTYGRSQTTLQSGGLGKLVRQYRANCGAVFADMLAPFQGDLDNKNPTVNGDWHLHNLLRACADDPVMRDTQDEFFDQDYWQRAVRSANSLGISMPLGLCIVYDSIVHGSWQLIRRRTINVVGYPGDVDEQQWLSEYVKQRRQWLANQSRRILRKTTYRMNVFQQLISSKEWALQLPIVVRGHEINLDTLSATPKGVYSGPPVGSRTLAVERPLQRGQDVRLLQLALSGRGHKMDADGIYGNESRKAVIAYQQANGLPATGGAGNEEFSAMKLI